MKQMDKAAKLLGSGRMRFASGSFTQVVEYDHPFQRITLEDGKIHLILGDGRILCGRVSSYKGRGGGDRASVRHGGDAGLYLPCPRCFMDGDLLALRIAPMEYAGAKRDKDVTPASKELKFDNPMEDDDHRIWRNLWE
jgi:hypothetical protein